MSNLQRRLKELFDAHSEWEKRAPSSSAHGRLHAAIAALKSAPKYVINEVGLTPLWVWPHDGTFSGETFLCAPLIDEANLLYRPGMTMVEVADAIASAHQATYNMPLDPSDWHQIKGAWVVPNTIWPLIGAMWDNRSIIGDSEEHAVRESQQRVVASVALFTLGDPVEDSE